MIGLTMSLLKYNPAEVEKANSGTELIALVLLSGGLLWVVVDESVSVALLAASLAMLGLLYLFRLVLSLRNKKSGLLLVLNYLLLLLGLSGMLPLIIPFHYPSVLRITLITLLSMLAVYNLFMRSPEEQLFYRSMRLLRIFLMTLFLLLLHFLPATE